MVGPVPNNADVATRDRSTAAATVAVVAGGGPLVARIAAQTGATVIDPAAGELKPALDGIETVVDVGGDPDRTRLVLDAAAAAGVTHAVLLSSATIYGASADNPVPLPEDAPVRPGPGFALAAAAAETERLGAEWRAEHDGTVVTVLRAAPIAGRQGLDELAQELVGALGVTVRGSGRPVQVVHEDDVASAVAVAVARRLDGSFNVAPDGWIAPDTAEALAGSSRRLALPERFARPVAAAGRALGIGRRTPGIDPYLEHPWVIANDRLRAEGWEPTVANEEALVGAQPSSWWRELSPRRRQELALGIVGATGAVAAAAAVVAFRRTRRARQSTRPS